MKKFAYTLLLGLLLGLNLSSCVHQFPEQDGAEGEVVLTVLQELEWLPDFEMNLTRADEGEVKLRYDFRVYPKGNTTNLIKEFSIFNEDISRKDFTTSLYLMPGDYDLYVWSDFAYSSNDNPVFYDDTNFADITYIKPYEGNTDLRDAFRGMTSFTVEERGMEEPRPVGATVTLSRPFARYKIIATDLADFIDQEVTRGKLIPEPASGPFDAAQRWARLWDYTVRVVYPLYMPAVFNNFLNNPVDSWTGISYTGKMLQLDNEQAMLALDYVMVNGQESGVQVMLEIYDPEGLLIARTGTITIETKRDRTTLVYGKFLTTLRNDGVGIDPDFDGEYNIEI